MLAITQASVACDCKRPRQQRKLLTAGIAMQNISLTVFDTNPFNSGNHDLTVNTLKVRLSGLPIYVDESAVVELLDKLGAKLKSQILYKK